MNLTLQPNSMGWKLKKFITGINLWNFTALYNTVKFLMKIKVLKQFVMELKARL